MAKDARETNTWVREVDLAVWAGLLVLLLIIAYRVSDEPKILIWWVKYHVKGEGGAETEKSACLSWREFWFMLAPVVTFGFTYFAHVLDKRAAGGGMARRGVEIEHVHNLEADTVIGTMTKLSVLVALAAIFIVIVQADPAQNAYAAAVRWFASAGFLVSIFLMLISVKTYDYANRFNWEAHPYSGSARWSYYRVHLARKAFLLDISAFYFLLFTAILATGLVARWMPIAASFLCGFVLWASYFFLGREPSRGIDSMKLYTITLAVHDAAATANWLIDELCFARDEKTGSLVKNGLDVQLQQVEATAAQGVSLLSFLVDDAAEVADDLRGEAVAVEGPKEFPTRKMKEVSVAWAVVPMRFIQRLK